MSGILRRAQDERGKGLSQGLILLTCYRVGVRIAAVMFALILAGGQGERLRPLTDRVPKPMVCVGGRPILWHQVRRLVGVGVTDVVFLTGYLGEVVEEYFGDGKDFGVRIHYSREHTPLGRGGALRKGLPLVGDGVGPVIATNGDVITDADMGELISDYRKRLARNPRHGATILTAPMVSPYGIVDTDDGGMALDFREKVRLPHWINGGVYVLNPGIRELLPEKGDHETTTFPALAAAGRMSAVATEEFWRSVDSLKDLREVEEYLAGGLGSAKDGMGQ